MWVITTCSICSPSCGHTPPLPSLGTQTSFFVRSVYMYAHSQPFLALSRQSLKLFFFFFVSLSLPDYSLWSTILKLSQSCSKVLRASHYVSGTNDLSVCCSRTSTGRCWPPPCSSQSFSAPVLQKDYTSGKIFLPLAKERGWHRG